MYELVKDIRETAKCTLSSSLQEMAYLEGSLIDTCTMAVVMLASFHPEELPGVPASSLFALTEVASYADAWRAVKRVMDNCISKYLASNETTPESGGGMDFRSQTGWSAFGKPRVAKTLSKWIADLRNVAQGVKGILVSSFGRQIR